MFGTLLPTIIIFYLLEEWWAASLLLPYQLWLVIAIILNVYFVKNSKKIDELWNEKILLEDEEYFLRIRRDDELENKELEAFYNNGPVKKSVNKKLNASKKIAH